MDRLDAMEVFCAAVDDGSLAAASRRFGRSAAWATRAVAMLEHAVGETLLLRSTRGLRLTAAGERHLAIWREVLARLTETGDPPPSQAITGTLVVTAPELFGRLRLMPIVTAFLAAHPGVNARVLLLNRVIDFVGEGIDIAVRLATLPDTSLVAVKLGELRRLLCASPDYLAAHGEPRRPADLANHVCIGLNAESDRDLWRFRREPGSSQDRSVHVRTRLAVNSVAAAHDAARRGLGLVRPLSYQVAEDIAAGRLKALLTDYEPRLVPAQLVFRAHPRRHSPTRAFIDYAVPQFRRALADIDALVGGGPSKQ